MLKSEQNARLLLGAMLEMSNRAQALGEATSISGVASLHAMQKSIQKNAPRIVGMLQEVADLSPQPEPGGANNPVRGG